MAFEADAGQVRQAHRIGGSRTLLVAFAALLLIAAGVLVAVKLLGSDDDKAGKATESSNDAFTLSYPQTWRPLSGAELRKLPGHPLAVVRRNDGKGFVMLRREGRAPKSFSAFSAGLTKALDKRVPDFQKRSAKIIKVRAGKAFYFSYIRTGKGTVHTVVVVPAGKRSYLLNTVSRGGAEVARQVARVILSFEV
jgi:hypothetical protein